ncbi:hypothetical protein CPC08DRAFT_714976 [Agrocybe pediades]|nr:hypothetical protein CPC08DRAFT_714976 [Agrocybe pediades]
MQPTKKASPISILHEELLWNIFLEIIDDALVYPWEVEHRPIVVIRCCSHVCGRWRSVILSSSTIWGRLIDLDYFHEQNLAKHRRLDEGSGVKDRVRFTVGVWKSRSLSRRAQSFSFHLPARKLAKNPRASRQ